MHTLLLSQVITKERFESLVKVPHYKPSEMQSSYCTVYVINSKQLNTISDEEKESMPLIRLRHYDFIKKKNDRVVCYTVEILINYLQTLGGTGFYSIPTGTTLPIVYKAIFELICKAIPEFSYLRYTYDDFTTDVTKAFNNCFPKQRCSDIAEMMDKLLDEKNYRYFQERDLFKQIYSFSSEYQVLLNPNISQNAKDSILLDILPIVDMFQLSRIDYSCDIYTDYKNILIELMGKERNGRNFKDKSKVYYGKNLDTKDIVVSENLNTKSVSINAYDKKQECIETGKEIPILEAERVENLLRIEVQVQKNRLNYVLKKTSTKENKEKRILRPFLDDEIEYTHMKDYIKIIIGTGNYFCYEVAKDIINNSHHKKDKKDKLCRVLHHISIRNGIENFLKCVNDGLITDCGKPSSITRHLKDIEALGVNPVTISRDKSRLMKGIQQKYPMPDIGKYRYGKDFLYNPLVYIELEYQRSKLIEDEMNDENALLS